MPKVSIIMGSQSDYATMKLCESILQELQINYETLIVSAHRTPDRLYQYATTAENNQIDVIIAGAGGAAHLPGMVASMTTVPVLGVPIQSKTLNGVDSLLSIIQMPGGIPVGTLAIGDAGAKNAALMAASILGIQHSDIRKRLKEWRAKQTEKVNKHPSAT